MMNSVSQSSSASRSCVWTFLVVLILLIGLSL
jgi:hypothetical protein